MLKQKLEKLGRIAIGAKTPDKRAMARPWHDTGVAMRRIVFGLCLAGLLASVVWLAQRGYGLVGIGIAFLFGLGALALMRLGERGKGAVAVVLLLIVPLFFHVGGNHPLDFPESAPGRLGGQTLPLGALWAAVIGVGLLLRNGVAALDRHRAVLVAGGVFVLAGLVLLVVGSIERGSPVNPLFYAQLCVPLLAVLPGLHAASREEAVRRIVLLVKWGLLLTSLAFLIQTLIRLGLAGLFGQPLLVHFGPLNVYQGADYVPFVLGSALLFVVIAEAHVRKIAWHDLIFIFVVGMTILGMSSRGAILTVMVGIAMAILLARNGYRTRLLKYAMLFVLIYMSGSILGIYGAQRLNTTVTNIIPSASIASPIGTFSPGEAASVPAVETETAVEQVVAGTSDKLIRSLATEDNGQTIFDKDRSLKHRRLGAYQALAYLRYHPVGGSFFGRPTVPEELAQDPIFTGKRNSQYLGVTEFGSPHNQYLDLALRGGGLWLTAFLVLVSTVVWRVWRTSRTANSPVASSVSLAATCVLLSTMLVSNFYQHNFAQPFSAFFLWYVVGIGLAVRDFNGSRGATDKG